MSSIHGVPAAKVGQVVQDFVDDGARNVIVQQSGDGSFTVSAEDASSGELGS